MKFYAPVALLIATILVISTPINSVNAAPDQQVYNPTTTEAQLNRGWAAQYFQSVNELYVDIESSYVEIYADVAFEAYPIISSVNVYLVPSISEELTVNWQVTGVLVNGWSASDEQIEELNQYFINSYIRYMRTQTIAIDATDVQLNGVDGVNGTDSISYTIADTDERRWDDWEASGERASAITSERRNR